MRCGYLDYLMRGPDLAALGKETGMMKRKPPLNEKLYRLSRLPKLTHTVRPCEWAS
jgi:hypothetical protein